MNRFKDEINRTKFSLRDALNGVFLQKRMIIVVFFTAAIAVTIISLLLPNQYRSTTKILVKNSRADVIVSPEQINNLTLTGEVSEAQVNSEIELIQSRDLLEGVVKKVHLARAFGDRGGEDSPVLVEKAIRQLENGLSITSVKKANIINISYTAKSAQQAGMVLKVLTELYLERHLQVHRIPGTDEFFKLQAEEYEKGLKDAQLSLAEFEAKNNIISLDLQKEMGLKRVTDAETDIQATDTTGQETARRIEKIKQQLQTLDSRIPTQRRLVPLQFSIERLSTMLVELRHKRTQLLTRFQPDDRLVKEVEQQIADTSEALNKVSQEQSVEQTSDINPLRQALELELARAQVEMTAKQARQENLSKQMLENRAKLATLEGTELKHVELERRVKEMKDNYDLFARKRDEALITDALDKRKISNVSIAETPTTPSLPVSPNRKLNLILGLFLAGFLGLGSGIGAEFFRSTVHTPRELETICKYPVLATVPYQSLPCEDENRPLLLGPGDRL